MSFELFKAFVLGVVEGLTEFLPVSSTGHLLLVQHFFGFDDDDFGKTFAILIQFGAILALLSIYFTRIWHIALGMANDPAARRFVIGLAQCVSMIPGVSRSGATIVAAMLLGADRRSAAEFSFWLAMPTMAGAFAYDLYKSRGQMSMDNTIIVAFGFAVSFVCAWIVVKTFLDYVQRHGLGLFAWWRVIVGALGLIALAAGY